MKRNILFKVLAFVLTVVMVFSSLPLMAFAENETPYVVSYRAPAIPMNNLTKVNLSDIIVEMDSSGTVAPGNLITWRARSDDGFSYNSADNTITAFAKGTYKLTTTYNGITKNVYVLVKEPDEDKFYLVNIPVLNNETFVADDWRIFGSNNDTDVTTSQAVGSTILMSKTYFQLQPKVGSIQKGAILVYVDEIFEDFADYTVETLTASNAKAATSGHIQYGNGVAGRISLNDAQTGYTTGIIGYIRQNKQVAVNKNAVVAPNEPYGFGGYGTASTTTPWEIWDGVEAYHTVKGVYEGSKFRYIMVTVKI